MRTHVTDDASHGCGHGRDANDTFDRRRAFEQVWPPRDFARRSIENDAADNRRFVEDRRGAR